MKAYEAEPYRKVLFSPPDIGENEIEEVVKVLRSGWITTGPGTKLLERRLAAYIHTGDECYDTEREPDMWNYKVVCLSSATAAEELNLRILGVGPGDEVIVPAYTYTASAAAAIHVGASVKFIDTVSAGGAADTHAPEMDYEAVADAITPRTKAVIAVDLGGVICDYGHLMAAVMGRRDCFVPVADDRDGLRSLSHRIQKGLHRVAIISDCAHALGAWRTIGGRRCFAGQNGDFSHFSFHAVKNLTTAEGGAGTWNLPRSCYEGTDAVTDEEIYRYLQMLSLHGQNKDALAKTQAGSWEYDVTGPWYKCNMTDVTAAIGLGQMNRYSKLLERRARVIKQYNDAMEHLGIGYLVHNGPGWRSSGHLYLIRVPGIDAETRSRMISALSGRGIECNVHYKPLPMMSAYHHMGWSASDFPNACAYYENLISLPLHSMMNDDDTAYVIRNFNHVVNQIR